VKSLKFVLQRDIFLQLLVASVGLAIYLPIARLDPDPHHDGLQIATAIGVGSGRAIHQSVFSQYGPITAWLQGSWVWVTSPTLLNIRVLTALQVVLIGALMCRVFLQLRVERMIAIGVPIGWLLACPVWATGIGSSFFPWSSITYGLFLLLSITTLIEWARRNDGRDKYGFASGLFIGLAIMTRTNLGVTFLIFLFISYLVIFVTTGRPSVSEIRWPFIGVFSGVIVPILILLSSKSFDDFIEQTVLGPLNGKSSTATSQSFLLINYIFLTLGFISLLIAIALIAKEKLDTPISKMLLVSFSFFVAIINLSDVKVASIN
jgi:4-amino-4-deoxy-L-arabinose transferase-like glycosyltransferase